MLNLHLEPLTSGVEGPTVLSWLHSKKSLTLYLPGFRTHVGFKSVKRLIGPATVCITTWSSQEPKFTWATSRTVAKSRYSETFTSIIAKNLLLRVKQTERVSEYFIAWQHALASTHKASINGKVMLLTLIINGLKFQGWHSLSYQSSRLGTGFKPRSRLPRATIPEAQGASYNASSVELPMMAPGKGNIELPNGGEEAPAIGLIVTSEKLLLNMCIGKPQLWGSNPNILQAASLQISGLKPEQDLTLGNLLRLDELKLPASRFPTPKVHGNPTNERSGQAKDPGITQATTERGNKETSRRMQATPEMNNPTT
ncbi:hypothetical protein DSO57_1035728 [Entomophthora muscae]|uniref:Uncharacterized protein n=1 Tax=Entomophthora muscae TaxID=34485 RepID=A0ACC2SZH4_9FUNG|nr:hypothetical protein DSO57_1035728 [Entomophthora muscae]